jgi:hypothetical protein
MKITVPLVHEKSAPKSHAYEGRTEDGILVKMWLPHKLVPKPIEGIEATVDFPEGRKKKKGKKRKQQEDDEDEDEDEEEG